MIYQLFVCILVPSIIAQQVTSPQGTLKGLFKKSEFGRQFEAYLGIPYAKPPVEELRFKSPVPFGKWEGVRSAVKEGSICLQQSVWNPDNAEEVGEEDCLYLNVYTPSSAKPKKYPVMVFIHGGGFEGGTGNEVIYEPDYLLDKDIVLVTLNYRLGALGFASTEDVELPGNFGLKDQSLALKWVKENIAAFGGNPDSVTIFGQSAGGASVHYHMVSPLSQGLFHRGIPMSGTAHCPWALSAPGVIAKRTRKLATLVGCPAEPSALLVECLRNIPAYLLIHLKTEFLEWDMDPVITFTPVIEPVGVKDAFLTVDPYTTPTKLPTMLGFTSQESAFRIAMFMSGKKGLENYLDDLNNDFDDLAPISLLYDHTAKNPSQITSEIKKFYFASKNITKEVLPVLGDLYTDCWFSQCSLSFVRLHKGPGPVYLYLFAHTSEYSSSFKQSNSTEYLGVNHGDDLNFLFPMKSAVDRTKGLSVADKNMREEMLTFYTNFATFGNPTPKETENYRDRPKTKIVKWTPSSANNMEYYHIEGGKIKMDKKPIDKRAQFWKNLQWRPSDLKKITTYTRDEL
ncbi:venom carboxylesterase-6 [Nilaparvata lugens]|uniref:venom carboxylesterase-6 n=1 Tax=Nilaparvata lugens TaxID=108931 RepID=UPI00193D1E84|nr:venom carboxylesterase-6 [Nilaparvata lugens]